MLYVIITSAFSVARVLTFNICIFRKFPTYRAGHNACTCGFMEDDL